MNSKTYLKTICNNFGGVKKYELEIKIIKLLEMKKREIEQSLFNEKLNNKDIKNIEDEIIITTNPRMRHFEHPEDAFNSNLKHDEQVLNFIENIRKRPVKWYRIDLVPGDCFTFFWQCCENSKFNIIFNEESEFSEFKVLKFKKENND